MVNMVGQFMLEEATWEDANLIKKFPPSFSGLLWTIGVSEILFLDDKEQLKKGILSDT
jgi:hypothetical protein